MSVPHTERYPALQWSGRYPALQSCSLGVIPRFRTVHWALSHTPALLTGRYPTLQYCSLRVIQQFSTVHWALSHTSALFTGHYPSHSVQFTGRYPSHSVPFTGSCPAVRCCHSHEPDAAGCLPRPRRQSSAPAETSTPKSVKNTITPAAGASRASLHEVMQSAVFSKTL